MDYSSVHITSADGYGKNFRVAKDADVQKKAARTASEAPAPRVDKAAEAESDTQRTTGSGTSEKLLKMTEPVERFMQSVGVSIKFHVDDDTKQIQAEVKSADGEKTIRKIPSDEILKLVASIKELTQSEHMLDKAL